MADHDTFGALLGGLRNASGLVPKLRLLSGAARGLRALSPRERGVLVKMAGLGGAEALVERLADGDRETEKAFRRVIRSIEERPAEYEETVRGLLDPARRTEAATTLIHSLDEALHEEEEPPSAPPEDEPEPATGPGPDEAAAARPPADPAARSAAEPERRPEPEAGAGAGPGARPTPVLASAPPPPAPAPAETRPEPPTPEPRRSVPQPPRSAPRPPAPAAEPAPEPPTPSPPTAARPKAPKAPAQSKPPKAPAQSKPPEAPTPSKPPKAPAPSHPPEPEPSPEPWPPARGVAAAAGVTAAAGVIGIGLELPDRTPTVPEALDDLRALRHRITGAANAGPVPLAAVARSLDADAPAWARRRTLQAWIDEAPPDELAEGLDRILELISGFARPSDRLWCLTSLAGRRPWDDDAWERIAGAVESPVLRRRLEHRRAG